jgi:hypothetical protein
VEKRVYAAPGRELKTLINSPLEYISPIKRSYWTAHKIPGAGFAQKKL